jgi:DNA-binding GntR family transcriptional regulator
VSRAADKAYDEIRKALLGGKFGIGARLKEKDLAATIGVSRTPVREALRRLNAEGLIDFSASHRAAVAQWTGESIDDLFRLRASLEAYAAALSAERISDAAINEMSALADKMEQTSAGKRTIDFDQISLLNSQFHKIILKTAANNRLQILMAGLIETTIVLRTYHRYTPAELMRSFGHHRELIAAFSAHDPEWARSVMTSHILAARASYVRANNDRNSALPKTRAPRRSKSQ